MCTKIQGITFGIKKDKLATSIYEELFKQMYRIYEEQVSSEGDDEKTSLKQKVS